MNNQTKLPHHPSEFLQDWMDGKRMSVTDTAPLLHISADELELTLSGKAPILPTLALRLEEIGWSDAESWIGTQAIWEIAQTRQKLGLPVKPAIHYTQRSYDLGFDVSVQASARPHLRYRPRCASIVVASRGTEEVDMLLTRFGEIRPRNGALLEHTKRDAKAVYKIWKKDEDDLPDDLQVLLIDPGISEVKNALRKISARILEAYPDDIGLDFYFAGHGERNTGNLILKDGVLSPADFLELQVDHVGSDKGGQRTIGIWLDSCHSGAFLLRLAIMSFEDFEDFRLDEGLASCLPDEVCWEMDILKHGVFTYTRLHPGNSHIDTRQFNQAIIDNNTEEIAKGLQGLVGMTSNPSAFLTEGKQFSMGLMKHVIYVEGGFATVELGEKSDFDEVSKQLTHFKQTKTSICDKPLY